MAATVSSPWGKPGAWALDAEEHEAELLNQHQNDTAAVVESADFPSLSAAAAAKPKKKKGQTLSLAEFTTYGSAKPSEPSQKGLTPEELLILPTGPRQRTAEELDRSRLGGGFKNFGNRYGEDSSRWGNSRAPEEGRRQGGFARDADRESLPSRADETDNWASGKKSFERRDRERGGGFFDSHSKADEVDSWVSSKTEVPRRFGGFDRDRRGSRGGFDSLSNGSGADSDNWGKKKEGTGRDFDNWGKKKEINGNGPGPSGRPRLVLQPRTLPVNGTKQETPKPKGSNPFGEARPREEVLREKGQDWKEIDEKLESIKIKEKESKMEREGSFGKRSYGLGNGRLNSPEDRTERTWRKPEVVSNERQQSEEKAGDIRPADD